MSRTYSARMFGGKRYKYLCWVKDKSSVIWFKENAKMDGRLMRVTRQSAGAFPSSGYNIWVK